MYDYDKEREERSAAYRRRRGIERPKIAYIPAGLTVDYEREYGYYIHKAVTFTPTLLEDFQYQLRFLERWYKKSVPQVIQIGRPDAAYGIAKALCRKLPNFVFREDLSEYLTTYRTRVRLLVRHAFLALITAVKAWNNEAERQQVCQFIAE